jgi:hypothetical protein
MFVWKDGKSAEISHEYFPDVAGMTFVSVNWLSFDADFCNGKLFMILVIRHSREIMMRNLPQREHQEVRMISLADSLSVNSDKILDDLWRSFKQ